MTCDPLIAEAALELIAAGDLSIRQIEQRMGLPMGCIGHWRNNVEWFERDYAKARRVSAQAMDDFLHEGVADPNMDLEQAKIFTAKAKVAAFRAEKLDPANYGKQLKVSYDHKHVHMVVRPVEVAKSLPPPEDDGVVDILPVERR